MGIYKAGNQRADYFGISVRSSPSLALSWAADLRIIEPLPGIIAWLQVTGSSRGTLGV